MQQHDTLLIACGSQESRKHLRFILQERFNLLEASNTRQMLLLLEQNMDCIAAVVLDISNWDVIDTSIQTDEHATGLLKQLPVIVVADTESYHDLTLYFRYGAADVLALNYDPYAMLHRIETITQLTLHKKHLEAIVAEQKENLRAFSDNVVDALASIIEYRNMESGLHIHRIRNFTRILLEEVMNHCPEYGLDQRLITIISSASALHDVGKIAIPDAILTKPDKLTPEEWEIMKNHSVLGYEILNSLNTTMDPEYLIYAYNICRYHHERWDGGGYPYGLKEEEIPICAQAVGLADAYDALTSARVYKDSYSHAQAANMILSGECGAFSPKLLECFKNIIWRFDKLNEEYAQGREPEKTIVDMSLPAPTAEDQEDNLMEKTRAKYYTMVHYLNAFLIEVQLDTGLFQVMYNPYPDIAQLKSAKSIEELTDIVACHVVIPEEKERMYQVLREEVPRFVSQDLRRQTYYFHHKAYSGNPTGTFEMTFLRIGGLNRRPSLAILCRKTEVPNRPSFQDDSIMRNSTECTYVCRNDSGFTLVRPGKDTHSLGGYTPQEVMDIFGGRLLEMAFPEDRVKIREEFDRQLKTGTMVRTEYRFLCKDGSVGWVNNKSRLVMGDDGNEYLQTFLYDITATKQDFERVSANLKHYQVILAQTENVLFDLDLKDFHIEFSETWVDIFGYVPSAEKLTTQFAGSTHVHPDDIPLLWGRLNEMKRGSDYEVVEVRIATSKGRYLWCRVRGSATRDAEGNLTRILGVIIKIDEEKRLQQELEDKANHDSLTQLLNKNAAKQMIERYLNRFHAPQCAMLVLDLDNFKEVNDRYGHLFGDALLTRISQILTDLFHSNDILARIGGDEFLVLVREVSDRQLLASQCNRLRDTLVGAFWNEGMELNVSCSIGIALCPEHGNTYYSLFTKADQALYQAKAKGKNDFCFHSEEASVGYLSNRRGITPIDSNYGSRLTQNDAAYQIFQILYQARDMNAAVNQVLEIMGKQTNVSRVYVFENSEDDTYCVNTFEWCNKGITPEIQNLQYVSYETDIPSYQDNFDESGVFYCHDVHDLAPEAYAVVEPQGIQSMLHCAIRVNGAFKGYIGFDECSRKRLWTQNEIQVLTYYSELLSMFIWNYREHEKSRQAAQELQTILENQNQWIYIIDPKSHKLLYYTGRQLEGKPEIQLGDQCFRTLRASGRPCAGCPLASLGEKQEAWAMMNHDGKQLLTEGKHIQWRGKDACLVTCHMLPE